MSIQFILPTSKIYSILPDTSLKIKEKRMQEEEVTAYDGTETAEIINGRQRRQPGYK
jgi:hypothetical protein